MASLVVMVSCVSESRSVLSNSLQPQNLAECSLPGSSVHGILQAGILEWVTFPSPGDLPNPGIEPRSPALQADSLPAEPKGSPRILEWVACPFSKGSSRPRNQTGVSCIAGGFFFTSWAIREEHVLSYSTEQKIPSHSVVQDRVQVSHLNKLKKSAG